MLDPHVRKLGRYERLIRWLVEVLDRHAENVGDRAQSRHDVAVQIQQDTCEEHGVFICPTCFPLVNFPGPESIESKLDDDDMAVLDDDD